MVGAAALLVGQELVGFFIPKDVEVEAVRAAVAKIQPYYANPTRYMPLLEFPKTSNGSVGAMMPRK